MWIRHVVPQTTYTDQVTAYAFGSLSFVSTSVISLSFLGSSATFPNERKLLTSAREFQPATLHKFICITLLRYLVSLGIYSRLYFMSQA